MDWKKWFKREPDKFITLLTEHAGTVVEGYEALEDYMRKQSDKASKRVEKAEKHADELRRILIDELNRNFITPFDREDIFALSRAIDDVLDYGYTTVDEMELLEVKTNEHLQELISLLLKAANEIHLAMQRIQEHPTVAAEHTVRAKALENRVENAYRQAIADLFQGPKDVGHVVEMLKLREIYRHLSNAGDRGDEAANIIADIIVKMT